MRKRNKILIGIIVLGLVFTSLVFVQGFLPEPPQCETGTQAEIDATGCIIGADLSGAIFLIIGIPIVIFGSAGLAASLLLGRYDKKTHPGFSAGRLIGYSIIAIIIFSIISSIQFIIATQ